MKIITLLNITLVIYSLILLGCITLIAFNPLKNEFGRLALPLLMFVLMFYVRTLHLKRNKAPKV